MEAAIFITIGIILLVIGLVSCILPPLPGPPIAFVALLLAYFGLNATADLPLWLMITYGFIALLIGIADNFVPLWSTKKIGGTKAGIRGSFIGILVGILLSPFGGVSIIICPFLGAMLGELLTGQTMDVAFRSGIGSFVGFLLTSGIKIILVLMMCYHFFKAVF
ncbi:MAG TPA: DUF456 family protein [Chitinophagales bacterium]|jgi:uncharacterized protein YqgC (DUF456 family)|nr:DUF456 family protein [Chitinophagales bacterium]HQO89396.1 DUF456 family protein [Chitinophagales bacterium]